MQEAELFELAEQSKEYGKTINDLKAAKAKIDEDIIEEMKSRELHTIEGSEWRVTVSEGEDLVCDPVEAKRTLKDRFKLIAKVTVDKDKLKHCIAEGTITVEEMEAFTTTKPRAAWPNITRVKP